LTKLHVPANPDYAYWYGWDEMTNDPGKIKELAKTMRGKK